MAVASTTIDYSGLGTGAAAVYATGIYANASNQIKVYADGVLKTIGSDYTLNGIGASGGVNVSGTFTNGAIVYVERVTPITQLVDTQNNETILEDVLDAQFDKLTMISQEIGGKAGRALLFPKGEAGYTLAAAASRVNKFIGFDASGLPVLLSGTGTDAALRTDLASTLGGSLVAYVRAEAGAVQRTIQQRFRNGEVDVRDFGATLGADGSLDPNANNYAALAAAITAASARKATVVIDGICNIGNNTVNVAAEIMIVGRGYGSGIKTTSATLPVLYISGVANAPGCIVQKLTFSSTVARTAGAFIESASSQGTMILYCRFDSPWNGIAVTGSAVQNLVISDCVINGALNRGITITARSNTGGPAQQGIVVSYIQRVLVTGPSALTNCPIGIEITSVGDLTLSQISTIYCATGLGISPRSAAALGEAFKETIQALYVIDSFFDTGQSYGVLVGGSGEVRLAKFDNVWCASNTVFGVNLSATGTVLKTEFNNCTIVGNGSGGLTISTTTVTNTSILGGTYAGNGGSGIGIVAGVSNWSVIGAHIGRTDALNVAFGPNTGYGILVNAGASNNYLVSGCTFVSNTLGQLQDSGTGANKFLGGNIGGGNNNPSAYTPPATEPAFDITKAGATTLAAAASLTLATGSGLVLVHDDTTGNGAVFYCYAGNVVKLGGAADHVVGAPGASQIGLQFTGGVYKVTNGYAVSHNIYAGMIRDRPSN